MSKIKESNEFIKDLKDKSDKGRLVGILAENVIAKYIIPALDQIQESLNELEDKLSVHDQEKFK
ncbi:MAG TPA: hypothetical protein VMW92_02100 [Candidatus Heimdallarchaeota archaeon]|nr:hypothetical protein [Candidatus Heimdallarchaeota archaeon]